MKYRTPLLLKSVLIRKSKFFRIAEKIKNLSEIEFWNLYEKEKDCEINRRYIVLGRAYHDLKFFADMFFKHLEEDNEEKKWIGHTSHPYNKMHLDYFKRFNPNLKASKEIIFASRGAAKTTLFCLIDPMHRALFGTEKFVVVLSSTAPLVRNKIKDIGAELISNERLNDFFNIRMSENSAEKILLTTDFGECYITGQGFFSQIRGLKKGSNRPTYILGDDTTHGERVFSEVQREKAKRQFYTDIFNTKEPDTSFLFFGTVIHKDDLIMDLSKLPDWKSFKYPSIESHPKNLDLWNKWESIYSDPELDVDQRAEKSNKFYEDNKDKMNEGVEVLWQEREDILYLMKERMTIGRKAFNAEKQMIPFLSDESLLTKIHWFTQNHTNKEGKECIKIEDTGALIEVTQEILQEHRFDYYYALDPATGERKTQSYKKELSFSARVLGMKDRKTGKMYIFQVIMDRKAPSEVIDEMYELHRKYNFVRLGVETNLFKDLFGDVIKMKRKEFRGKYDEDIYLPIYEIYANEKKEQRIYTIEPPITRGDVMFSKSLIPKFVTQLEDYPNCTHNDGLDALEILLKISDPKNKLKRSHIGL